MMHIIKLHCEHRVTYSLGGNDVLFLILVKPCHSFDDHVVTLRGTRGEDNVFGLGTDEVCDMLDSKMK